MLAVQPALSMFGVFWVLPFTLRGVSLCADKDGREVGNLQRRVESLPRSRLAGLARIDHPELFELRVARFSLFRT